MKTSKLAQREARQLFRSCHFAGVLDENRIRRTVALLLAQKSRGYMEVLTRLHRLVKLDLEQRAARVESPAPLPADLQTDVARRIRTVYGPGVDVSFAENPALVGGLKIRVGSDLYDGSVKTKLEGLAASF
ncbi:MAG: F0F1 ATP synthase subunit delta [Verrucomicrobiota bacterium]|nr:F0F1 ATP synthase subunit delta [Verrucomicrobiota bacterium]MDE3066448.1 F0F1 ATP synthase subunit delta [Verrucomicrobiota bacterium]